ncbi:MAG: peptidase domain-containing ABC transporter [Clostridium sp.]|nr:peptidase domain-containing ABC transporter [Prevotella sp.]MCM1428605.1 peptidase domain-containing ABC transporter [Clostridium sp.]MCM1476182.1 peptidase domain-containing ABC transporter [Muribaculaceae bacterium]
MGLTHRFPFIKQLDSTQCGLACLAMICRHFGAFTTIGQLEQRCTPTSEGVSLKGISDVAAEMGIESVGLKISIDQLDESLLPCILHWNQNHFVVLYGVNSSKTKFYIADPGKGKIKYNREELARHWIPDSSNPETGQGIAMVFEPNENFRKTAPSRKALSRALKYVCGYLKEYRRYFLQIVVGLAIGCILELIFPFLTQQIVDTGIRYRDIGFIWLILLGELFIIIGSTTTDFIRRWLLLHISLRINVTMVSDFFIKLMKLPMSFFDTKQMGDLLQRMSDHSRVQSFMTGQTLNLLFSIMSLLVFGVVLCFYSPLIFGVYMAGSIAYVLWISIFLHRRKVLDYEVFEQQAINSEQTVQLLSSMQEIKLQNCERRERHKWEDVQAELFMLQMKSLKLQQSQEGGSVFINELKNILVTVLAASAVIDGSLTLGGMLAIQYIIGQLNSPTGQMIEFIRSIQDVKISLERISEVTELKEENEGKEEGTNDSPITSQCAIRIKDVTFRYDRHSDAKAIDKISIDIPVGKTTAIVGSSGSGKTTLLKLLLGYYTTEEGRIEIYGRNIEEINLRQWRSRCGCVMQDGIIFADSILQNIATDEVPDMERVRHAAATACIDTFIDTLPLGYHTRIGKNGIGLSKGQRQRILIARAVYRNPDVIFMDEATNSLDAVNESQISKKLNDVCRGKTKIIIAHRLSTVKDADNIIVLDNGKVAEQGTHSELIQLRGIYYNLIQNQLELGE